MAKIIRRLKWKFKNIEIEKDFRLWRGHQNNIPGIDADCGGSMACAAYHVYV